MFESAANFANEKIIHYPIDDSSLSFADYMAKTRELIETRRQDLLGSDANRIIAANMPFELQPQHIKATNQRLPYGALMLHGLFECPFSMQDLGKQLAANGVLCRSLLLPGHGTHPSDLLSVSYKDWIQAACYGIESLKQEVDQLIIVGYSTGAALAVYHALQDKAIAGIILLAPAIKITTPIELMLNWHKVVKHISYKRPWIYREDEIDYAKYLSLAYHPVIQVRKLTEAVEKLQQQHTLSCPLFLAVTYEDEAISARAACDFFYRTQHPQSELLLYSAYARQTTDARVTVRHAHYPKLRVQHFSHRTLPFAPNNSHYGQEGDYLRASHLAAHEYWYGAYNPIEESYFDLLYKLGVAKHKRRELTYNPDFDFMAEKMVQFALSQFN